MWWIAFNGLLTAFWLWMVWRHFQPPRIKTDGLEVLASVLDYCLWVGRSGRVDSARECLLFERIVGGHLSEPFYQDMNLSVRSGIVSLSSLGKQ